MPTAVALVCALFIFGTANEIQIPALPSIPFFGSDASSDEASSASNTEHAAAPQSSAASVTSTQSSASSVSSDTAVQTGTASSALSLSHSAGGGGGSGQGSGATSSASASASSSSTITSPVYSRRYLEEQARSLENMSLHSAATSSSSSRRTSSSSRSSTTSSSASTTSSLSSSSLSSQQQSSSSLAASQWDVILKNDESADRVFGPVTDDKARGDLLRQAVAAMQSSDTLLIGDGTFDLDCKNKGSLLFPNNVAIVGESMDETHLFADCWSDNQGSAFEVRNGQFSDLTFENASWQTFEDGRTIEMYTGYARTADNVNVLKDANGNRVIAEANPGPYTANFHRVKFVGTAWTIYNWSNRGHHWNIYDSVIVSGRQGLSMMSSAGETSQYAYVTRTIFDIDTMRSRDIGATSNQSYGGGYAVVARSGHVTVEDSEFHMTCGTTPHRASYVPRCVGIYDGNDFATVSSMWNYVVSLNNRWFVNGNGSPDTYDILMTNDGAKQNLQLTGGCGSGAGCLIIKNW